MVGISVFSGTIGCQRHLATLAWYPASYWLSSGGFVALRHPLYARRNRLVRISTGLGLGLRYFGALDLTTITLPVDHRTPSRHTWPTWSFAAWVLRFTITSINSAEGRLARGIVCALGSFVTQLVCAFGDRHTPRTWHYYCTTAVESD